MQGAEHEEANKLLSQFTVPPRIKPVQGQSKKPVSDMYNAGDVCLVPTLAQVMKKGGLFTFVPLYFFPEWLETNPVEANQFIRDRSLDPKSLIAAKARDAKRRREPWDQAHGGNDPTKFVKFVEVLNFVVAIVNHESLTGIPAVIGFANSEHKTGTALSTSIRFRSPVPMYGTVWDAKTSQRDNGKGQWYGFDISQHQADRGLVMDEEAFKGFKKMYEGFKQTHLDQRIAVNYDEELVEAGAADELRSDM